MAGISKSLEQKLIADGGIDSDTLELAMEQCANTGGKLIEHLVSENFVEAPKLATIISAEIGEESGALDDMLEKVADHYEDSVDNLVDQLTALLEPLIMCVLAVLVGGLLIAMYLPIFQLGNVM